MRLMNRDLKSFSLFRTEKAPNGYVGTSLQEREICRFQAVSKPVSDKLSAELYGERIKNMTELTALKKGDFKVLDGDIFTDGSERKFKVISVCEYSDHYVITGEKL